MKPKLYPNERTEPIVDLNRLASTMGQGQIGQGQGIAQGPLEYAPLAVRERELEMLPIKQVLTFGELPTKELDDIVAAVEAELAALKKEAQVVRDLYVKHTTRIADDMKRLQEGVRLSMETIKTLHNQCIKLNEQAEPGQ